MSDYLERLVARSFDPPDAIRPRPQGLFEPARLGSAPTEPVPGEEAPVGPVRPPAAVLPPRTEVSPREVAVIEVPVPAMPVSPPVPSSRAAAVTDTAPVRPVRAAVVAPAPPRDPPHETVSAQPHMTPPPQRERAETEPPPLSLERTIVQPLQREVIVERPAVAERRTEQPRRERHRPPAVAAEPPARRSGVSHVAPPQQAARPRPIRPQVTAPRAPDVRSRRDSDSPAEPAAAPSIHVTIGRVEVRAVVPPAAAARRRPAAASPAVMSLDEYLKQRAGGDRS